MWLAAALVLVVSGGGAGEVALERLFAAPAFDAPLGRDELGRSLLPRVITGGGLSLAIALATVTTSALLGTLSPFPDTSGRRTEPHPEVVWNALYALARRGSETGRGAFLRGPGDLLGFFDGLFGVGVFLFGIGCSQFVAGASESF